MLYTKQGESKIIYSEVEALPRRELKALQNERLMRTIRYAYDNSPFYNMRFKERGVQPNDIHSTQELIDRVGIVTSKDIIEHQGDTWHENKFISVRPFSHPYSAHYTSGSRGKNKIAWRSAYDWQISKEKVLRAYSAAGIGETPSVLLDMLPMGVNISGFASSLATHPLYGRNLQISILTAGTEPIIPVEQLVKFHQPTAIISTASNLMINGAKLKEGGVDVSSVKKIITVGEPSRTAKRREIGRRFNNAQVFDLYASNEGDAMTYECEAHDGLHVSEDYLLVTPVNPKTHEILPSGIIGMDVTTTLIDEKDDANPSMVLLNYHHGDKYKIVSHNACSCGRTFMRISHPTRYTKGVFDIGQAKLSEDDLVDAVTGNGFDEFGIGIVESQRGHFDVHILVEAKDGNFGIDSIRRRILDHAVMKIVTRNGVAELYVKSVPPDTLDSYLGTKRSEIEIRPGLLKELI